MGFWKRISKGRSGGGVVNAESHVRRRRPPFQAQSAWSSSDTCPFRGAPDDQFWSKSEKTRFFATKFGPFTFTFGLKWLSEGSRNCDTFFTVGNPPKTHFKNCHEIQLLWEACRDRVMSRRASGPPLKPSVKNREECAHSETHRNRGVAKPCYKGDAITSPKGHAIA